MIVRPRLIVFDDEICIRNLLQEHFESFGCEVLASPEPLTCPIYLGEERCSCPPGVVCGDMLITDNRMPRMTGIEFIRRQLEGGCRGITRNKVIVSAFFTNAELEEIRRLGCQYFEKPFHIREVERWVESVVASIDPARHLRTLV